MIYLLFTALFACYISLVIGRNKVIFGCETRGDYSDPYLSRWTLLYTGILKCYFHKFHRSDADDLHDHPWSFISIILWRGYNEVTFKPGTTCRTKRRIFPGMIIFRKATHAHRVELINDKPAYTIVLVFKYVRQWGFFINNSRWQIWTEYFKEKGC